MKLKNTLGDKHFEPLVVRRCIHKKNGVLYFVALICGDNLDKLDELLLEYETTYELSPESLQSQRNWVGNLSEKIINAFDKVEGCAVILYTDKVAISSLWGDFMSHMGCRNELYQIINWMNGV